MHIQGTIHTPHLHTPYKTFGKKCVWINKLLVLSDNLSMHSPSGCTFSIHMPFLFQKFISLYLKAGRPSLFTHLKKLFLVHVNRRKRSVNIYNMYKKSVSVSTATVCTSKVYNRPR